MTFDSASANGAAAPVLPVADSRRWQPIRGGLLNIYRYDYEEFRYEQGRLLLRGDNGTGKSRVLALQLPFLLDGEVAPHRLEPDGDPAKRIEWNLLLGKHQDRLGYTWLELGRRDGGGARHYLTLGAGLRAVEGRGLVGKWFFITRQRIGEDLFLQSAAGPALTRERLAEAIGDRGEIVTSASAYRRAVDAALFKLGEHRYGALVDLLVQLRQPQLSRQLDERRLSAALSEALPPVALPIVADVAESFRSLEADRVALEAFQAASRGVEQFLEGYRRYTRVAARRRADDVRRTHAAYEAAMRRLRAAETERDARGRELEGLEVRIDRLVLGERAAATAVETLLGSPQMRDAQALDHARRAADQRAEEAKEAETALARAREARVRWEHDRDEAMHAVAVSHVAVAEIAAQAADLGAAAGLDAAHRAAVGPLALPDGRLDPSALDAAERHVEQAVGERLRAARHVRELAGFVDAAQTALSAAKQSHTELTAQLDEVFGAQRMAHEALAREREHLARAFRAWTTSLVQLEAGDPDVVVDELTDWCQTTAGPSPVATRVRQALDAAIDRLARRRAEIEQRRTQAVLVLDRLRADLARLAGGQHLPPPAPYTRDEFARTGRAGAPLWLLCDFRPSIDKAARAGLEAALEASGLLDAWVTPDGALLPQGVHDTAIVPGTSPEPEADGHLGLWLLATVDHDDPRTAGMTNSVVSAVLRHIGARAGAGHIWVDVDGHWQLGPLHGAWTKPAAAHIGEGAREAARRGRLAALAVEIAGEEEELALIDTDAASVVRSEQAARNEAGAAPGDDRVRAALAAIVEAGRTAAALRIRVSEAETRVADRRQTLDAAIRVRDDAAQDLGIAAWVADLGGLEDAIGAYRRAVAGLWPTGRHHASVANQASRAVNSLAEAVDSEGRHAALLLKAREKARTAAVERDTLEQSIGAAVEEVLKRLADARAALETVQSELKRTRDARETARVSEALARQGVDTETQHLQADAAQRDVAIAALKTFGVARLLDVAQTGFDAGDPPGWSVTRAVEVARGIETAFANFDSDDGSWQRVQRDIHASIQRLTDTLLPYDYQPGTTIEDGLFVVTVPFRGRTCTMTDLCSVLAEEVTSRRVLLDAREREILENHLIGEVSAHLHERLRAAEALVREMNEELRTRHTSTGMTLRFTWEPLDDGPPGLLEARARLLRAGGTWSPAERQALGAFLQDRIRAVRAANETETWQEHLTAAFDYRAWHHFCVERQQDGQWKRLTRRTHGTGSGGEKAIALTIPQFAAAAAHYRTADPLAPRLILLDEAFVGIDKPMRAQCMGLLRAFDLDFVMTSEQEWGCYASVPGIAIYHLSVRPGIEAVGVTRWVWNGRERTLDDQRLPTAAPPDSGQLVSLLATPDGDGAVRIS
jgi:uncharacterized protein (TIGR02680 family)